MAGFAKGVGGRSHRIGVRQADVSARHEMKDAAFSARLVLRRFFRTLRPASLYATIVSARTHADKRAILTVM
jgi:hypothetical protein